MKTIKARAARKAIMPNMPNIQANSLIGRDSRNWINSVIVL